MIKQIEFGPNAGFMGLYHRVSHCSHLSTYAFMKRKNRKFHCRPLILGLVWVHSTNPTEPTCRPRHTFSFIPC